MELGNALFGNSRGKYPVNRAEWQGLFWGGLLHPLGLTGYGYCEDGSTINTDVFEIFPYYWGECTCGFDYREAEFFDGLMPHEEDCYQVALTRAMKAEGVHDFLGDGMEEIYQRLTSEYGLPMFGCAVHCTCKREEEIKQWYEENGHDPDCPTIKPNFLYKPTGFSIQWYKYPMRDAYANQDITTGEFEEILTHCRESYLREVV